MVQGLIKDELTELEEECGDPRRTVIVESTSTIGIEDLIAQEDMVVTVSRTGYIKRNPVSLYASQHRGQRQDCHGNKDR